MPLFFTNTVVTRHLLDTQIHDTLEEAQGDAADREGEWVVIQQEDPKTEWGVPGPNVVVDFSSPDAKDYAGFCLGLKPEESLAPS